MEKETLEEAANKIYPNDEYDNETYCDLGELYREKWLEGAEWQAERMYSEEEVIELLQKYRLDLSSGKTANIGDTTKFWFEQFKNK
jgi:hypothetical protein